MTNETMKKLGVNREDVLKHYNTLDELRATTPGMVVAKAVRYFKYSIDKIKKQKFKEGQCKIINLFLYERLEYDKDGTKYLEPADKTFGDVYNPYNGQDLSGKTLLVWRTGGIGDLLFIKPSLVYLKEKYPDCKIWFGCGPFYFDLINTWECLDDMLHLPISLEQFEKADYHTTFEGVIERCKEAESTNAYKLFSNWMGLDISDDKLKPVQIVKKRSSFNAAKIIYEEFGIERYDYIVAQVRASSPVRTPSIGAWKKIFEPLLAAGHKIIITDRPELHAQIDKLISVAIDKDLRSNMYNFSKYSKTIDISIGLIKYSKLIIAPDSSMVHVGASLGVPVMGIYGPFPGDIRMGLYDNADWIEPEESDVCTFKGHSCCIHGHNPCPEHENSVSPCFDTIDFKLAQEKIETLLQIRGSNNA